MKNISQTPFRNFRDLPPRFIQKSKIQNLKSTAINGFSTVELLITLFVAAAFLLSGYQLYSMIIKDGGETRMQARASNAAYDYLQRYKTDTRIDSTCDSTSSQKLVTDDKPTIAGLSGVNINVTMSCPFTATPTITKLEVKLEYGNGKSVTQATYVKK